MILRINSAVDAAIRRVVGSDFEFLQRVAAVKRPFPDFGDRRGNHHALQKETTRKRPDSDFGIPLGDDHFPLIPIGDLENRLQNLFHRFFPPGKFRRLLKWGWFARRAKRPLCINNRAKDEVLDEFSPFSRSFSAAAAFFAGKNRPRGADTGTRPLPENGRLSAEGDFYFGAILKRITFQPRRFGNADALQRGTVTKRACPDFGDRIGNHHAGK